MSSRFQDSLPIFQVLFSCSPSSYSTILNDKTLAKTVIFGFVELAHNVLYEELPLSDKERLVLRENKEFLRALASHKSAKTLAVRERKLGLVQKNRKATKLLLEVVLKGSLKDLCSENID